MTTREAIAIVREHAPLMDTWDKLREAMLLVATIAERHADRNRQNKRRQRRKARVSEGCKEVARRMAEKDPGGGGLWRLRK